MLFAPFWSRPRPSLASRIRVAHPAVSRVCGGSPGIEWMGASWLAGGIRAPCLWSVHRHASDSNFEVEFLRPHTLTDCAHSRADTERRHTMSGHAHAAASVAVAAGPPVLPSPPAAVVGSLSALVAHRLGDLVPPIQAALHQWGASMHTAWVAVALAHVHASGRLPALSAFLVGSSSPPSGGLIQSSRDSLWPLVIDADLLAPDTGVRRLPAELDDMHRQTLDGVHLVQLHEWADVAHSQSELADTPNRLDRVWKLTLTDGEDMYTALEKTKCASLTHERMQPGVKVRRGARSAAAGRIGSARLTMAHPLASSRSRGLSLLVRLLSSRPASDQRRARLSRYAAPRAGHARVRRWAHRRERDARAHPGRTDEWQERQRGQEADTH